MAKGPLCAALVVALIAGCKSSGPPVNPVGPSSACSGGVGNSNRNAPIVCVDGSSGSIVVNPASSIVWNVSSTDRKTPPVIVWLARSGGSLQIAYDKDDCVNPPSCDGKGRCVTNVKSGLGAGAKPGEVIATCKYTVTLDGKSLDPDTVVVGCCSEPLP